jgi:predicted peptidase
MAATAALGTVIAACSGPAAVPSGASATTSPPTVASETIAPSPSSSQPFRSSAQLTFHATGTVAGANLGFAQYLPPGYGDGSPRPVLVALHSSGESGPGTEASLESLALTGVPYLIMNDKWPADRSFIVLMPQHDITDAAPCIESQEIADFLAFALKIPGVDADRVYLTGISCGAIGGWAYLAQHTNEVVAAAVLIAGDGRPAFKSARCALGAVPIWAIHGALDTVVDPRGSTDPIRSLKACTKPRPADARVTVLPGLEHNAWFKTYDMSAGLDVYAWLLTHTRSAAAS